MSFLNSIIQIVHSELQSRERRKQLEIKEEKERIEKENLKREADHLKEIQDQLKLDQNRQIEVIKNCPVHPKFDNIVNLASHFCPTSAVDKYVFDDTKDYGSPIIFSKEKKQITVYLYALYEKAFECVRKLETEFSFRADIWWKFLWLTFNEFIMACETSGEKIQINLDNLISVTKEDSATGKMMAYAGKVYDVEPPRIADDLFFGPLINNAIEHGIRRNELWAERQKNMIYDVYWFPASSGLAPTLFRNVFKLITGNLDNKSWPMYVPSFQATKAEIDQVKKENIEWEQFCEELDRKHAESLREIAEGERAHDEFFRKFAHKKEGYKITYINHCWKCGATINSEYCKEDPGNGYFCNDCGASLRTWPGGYLHNRL